MSRATLLTIEGPAPGQRCEVAGAGPLLAEAEAAGQAWPSSCRTGACRACRCLVVQGRAVHLIDWPSLSPEERLEGWILPCVARAQTALVLRWPRLGE